MTTGTVLVVLGRILIGVAIGTIGLMSMAFSLMMWDGDVINGWYYWNQAISLGKTITGSEWAGGFLYFLPLLVGIEMFLVARQLLRPLTNR